MSPLPVTLLSGFLGSGKTSLLKHVLQNREGIRCAVIVNEITEENIDSYALGGTKLLHQGEELLSMEGGCICCGLQKNFVQQLRDLAASGNFDSILVEASGISEPMQVAQAFYIDPKDGKGPLNQVVTLDTCVTVVDATTLMDRLRDEVKPTNPVAAGLEKGRYLKKEVGADGNPENIGTLMAEQIEYANVVILNKADRFAGTAENKQDQVKQLTNTVRQLNPVATVLTAEFCKVDLKQVLGTGKCTQEFSESVRGWMTDLPDTHVSETEEYGVRSFVFHSTRPFHPLRLHQWVSELYQLEEMKEDEEDDEADENDDDDSDSDDDDSFDDDDDDDENSSKKKKNKNKITIEKPKIDPALLRKRRTTKYGGEIFRVKGFVWLGNPSRLGFYVTISAAGDIMSFLPGGGWGTFPVRSGSGTTQIEPCQRLAFLGQYLDKERMQKDLEECLLTKEEESELKKAMMEAAKKSSIVAVATASSQNKKKKQQQVQQKEEPPADIFDDPFAPFGDGGEEDDDHEGHSH